MYYINIEKNGKVETVDQFDTYEEAIEAKEEYLIASDWYYGCYISQICTEEWEE